MQFYQLAIGAEFEFANKRYEKTAMGMARVLGDWRRRPLGNIFPGSAEVVSEGPMLPPEEAERWKPVERPWTDYLTPAPPPVEKMMRDGRALGASGAQSA